MIQPFLPSYVNHVVLTLTSILQAQLPQANKGGFRCIKTRVRYIGSVIQTKSNLDRGLGNLWTPRSLPQWVILRRQMLFQSTPYAFMKLFTISGVNIKAFGKLKTAWNAAAALVSRVSRLRLSTLASACTFLTEQRARVHSHYQI